MLAAVSRRNSTFIGVLTTEDSTSQVSAIIWLHIVLMVVVSLLFYPVIFILKKRNHSWLIALEITTLIAIFLGTAVTFFQSRSLHSTSHSVLGYFLVLSSATYLALDIYHSRPSAPPSKSQPTTKLPPILHLITHIALPIFLYIEIVLGIIAILGFCSSPYTQQCFGHLGIGSVYLLYFSFWAILVISNDSLFSNLKSEVLDAALLVPCGLGLTFFGHAWGYPWDSESLQHVCLGIFTLIAMILSVYLSTDSNNQPRRNIFPGLVSLTAGYTFLSHPSKPNILLSSLHQAVGLFNTGIGICRILDVVFVTYISRKEIGLRGPFNALASFLGINVGIITMIANEEQAALLSAWGVGSQSVFMAVLVVGVGVMGYVSVVASSVGYGKRVDGEGYMRVEMEEMVD